MFSHKTRGGCNEGPLTAPRPPGDCNLGCRKGPFSSFFDVPGKAAELRGFEISRISKLLIQGIDRWTGINGDVRLHENVVDRNQYGVMNQVAEFILVVKP